MENENERVLTDSELAPFREAADEYRRISRLYLDGKIGDDIYMAARSEWDQSQKDFDEFITTVG